MFFQERRFSRPPTNSGTNSTTKDRTLHPRIKAAIKYVEKKTSLTWFDHMMFRIIFHKECSETRKSLEEYDMDYMFKLNEYLDSLDYLEEVASQVEQ